MGAHGLAAAGAHCFLHSFGASCRQPGSFAFPWATPHLLRSGHTHSHVCDTAHLQAQASLAAPAPTPADMDKGDKRQALKDAWTALNRGLEPALTQQVRRGWSPPPP